MLKFAQNCEICKVSLPESIKVTRQTHCAQIKCKMAWQKKHQDRLRERNAIRKQAYKKEKERQINRLLEENRLDRKEVSIVELPYLELGASSPSKNRIEDFVSFLNALLESMDDIDEEELITSPNSTLAHSPEQLNTQAFCATCRGKCCYKGRQYHSFLQRHTLQRIFKSNSNSITPENIVDTYLAQLPDESITDACLYQTSVGCVLPEYLRADICSEFYCENLSEHINQKVQGQTKKHTVVINQQDHELIGVHLIE